MTLRLRAPGSKSLTIRHLLAAGFAPGRSRLHDALDAADTRAMAAALTRLGASVRWGNPVVVEGIAPPPRPGPLELDCGESGAVLRLLAAALAHGRGRYRLLRRGRLPQRPTAELEAALARLGARSWAASDRALELEASGEAAGSVTIALGEPRSSQHVSALLLAAPLGGAALELEVGDRFGSAGYVTLTCQAMARHGVAVARTGSRYRVAAGARYHPADLAIEGDWSSAAALLAAAAIAGRRLELAGLNRQSAQPDRAVVELLGSAGAEVKCTDAHVCISNRATRPFRFDFDAAPDLAPVAAALAAAIPGRSTLTGLARLADKESDRLAALAEGLRAAGAAVEVSPGRLDVRGGALAPARIDGKGDHRIVMAFALLGLVEPGLAVSDREAVGKSFPGFFDCLARIAGDDGR